MRASLIYLVLILLGPGCSLTVRNPLACLFDGPPVCGARMTCDAQLNQCVPIAGAAGDMAAGDMSLPDTACSSAFCQQNGPLFSGMDLLTIWGSSASDIFVMASPNRSFHWNGTAWELQTIGSPTINAIIGLTGKVWAVGDAGTIFLRSPLIFLKQASVGAVRLRGIWMETTSSIWIVGDAGSIYNGDGSSWTLRQNQPAAGDFRGIWGADGQHIWAVSNTGVVAFYDGSSWDTTTNLTSGATLASVSGTSATNVWAVGVTGLAYHFDGTSWTLQQKGLVGSPSLESVWAVDSNTAWAVGDGGVYKWEKNSWSLQLTPSPSVKYHGVWNLNGRETWVVGDSGTFLYLNTP